MKVIPETNRRN